MNLTNPYENCCQPKILIKKQGFWTVLTIISILLFFSPLQKLMGSNVIVGGIINQNTVWSGQNTYVANQTVVIPNDVTLTIEAGAKVLFSQASGLRVEGGSLFILGEENDSIVFGPNYQSNENWLWNGIAINAHAMHGDVAISYAQISKADVAIETGGTGIPLDNVSVDNSSIINNNVGIRINNASGWNILDNRITNNVKGLDLLAFTGGHLTTDNTIQGNHFNNSEINIYLETANNASLLNNSIRNNLIEGAAIAGIRTFQTSGGLAENNLIERNVLKRQNGSNGGFGIQLATDATIVINNIFFNNSTAIELKASEAIINQNSFYKNINSLIAGVNASQTELHQNTISSSKDLVLKMLSTEDIDFRWNNIMYNTHTINTVRNLTALDVSAPDNYWGTTDEEIIGQMIFDGNDDDLLGFLFYDPIQQQPLIDAPMAPPKNVSAQQIHGQTKVWWRTNKEDNLAGYRIYFGDFDHYSFSDEIDGLLTDTLAVLPFDLPANIGVTACNESWEVTDGQLLGHESPFSFAAILPWAGDDATICANQTVYNIQHSTAPPSFDALQWSTSGDGIFGNPSILRPVYFPGAEDKALGVVTLTLTVDKDAGQYSDSFVLFLAEKPVIELTTEMLITPEDGYTSHLVSVSGHDALLWSSDGDGTFSHPDSLFTTYHPGPEDIDLGKVRLTLTAISNYCGSVSANTLLYIRDTYSVSGRVHSTSGMAASHPVIATRMNLEQASPRRAITHTDANGNFLFDKLYEGEYVFYAVADTVNDRSILSTYHPVHNQWQDAFVHELKGNIFDIDIRLNKAQHILPPGAGSISGVFLNSETLKSDLNVYFASWFDNSQWMSSNNGLPNASVWLLGESQTTIYQHTLSDSDGIFRFTDLPFGIYKLKGEVAGFQTETSSVIELSAANPHIEEASIYFNHQNHIVYSIPPPNTSESSQLSLFPNPASTEINISAPWLDDTGEAEITLFNRKGQLVMHKTISPINQTVTIDIETLPEGMYILRIKIGNMVFNKKFLRRSW